MMNVIKITLNAASTYIETFNASKTVKVMIINFKAH